MGHFSTADWQAQVHLCEIATQAADGVLVLFESYFDESCTERSDGVQAVSGYVISSVNVPLMLTAWEAVLRQYDLPYFHMVECAHSSEKFRKYREVNDRNTPAVIARQMIEIIKAHVEFGITIVFNPKVFKGFPNGSENKYKELYVSVVQQIAMYTATCIGAYGRGQGHKLALTFEAGHKQEKLAGVSLSAVMGKLFLRTEIISTSFQTKTSSPLLQAADILAWHSTTHIKGCINGRNIRKDFKSLLEAPHLSYHMINMISMNSGSWIGCEEIQQLIYARQPVIDVYVDRIFKSQADYIVDLPESDSPMYKPVDVSDY